jgi:hypothetical protein
MNALAVFDGIVAEFPRKTLALFTRRIDPRWYRSLVILMVAVSEIPGQFILKWVNKVECDSMMYG